MAGGSLPAGARELTAALTRAAGDDPRIVGLTLGGSAVTGELDEFSDLDFLVVCRDGAQAEMLADARELAAGLGPLLTVFTAEHVGEPRLLIGLYGPPLLHVDLKFIGVADLASRVEDGIVVWERDGAVTAALHAAPAQWPGPDLQWIEDRFWAWVHYTAAKLGRGELFECVDALAYFRANVLGPLLAEREGRRPQGTRRLEQFAGSDQAALEATVAEYGAESCAAALRATIALYLRLRDSIAASLVLHVEAQAAALDYLAAVEARLGA